MVKQLDIKKIAIIGGGTAGWMAALLLEDAVRGKGIEITVLESPMVGTIGVGEGSTAAFKRFFDVLGIEETEWMPECNATYKVGIRFDDWSTKPGYESYFHPFVTVVDNLTGPQFVHQVGLRMNGADVHAHPDRFFLSAHLANRRLAPIASENFPFQTQYGYHFDATLLAKFMQKKALQRGVRYQACHVVNAILDEQGYIDAVATKDAGNIHADFFVDCSGFSALLIDKALATPFYSYADNLLNDSAVAMPSKMTTEDIPCETVSTAMKYGWSWQIPLTNRFGNGYVYSSAFCSKDEAERELREKLGLLEADVPVRHLSMKLGRVEQHWNKNCLAVGLSQGFLEPLEATALYLTQMTLGIFSMFLQVGNLSEEARAVYNQQINEYFDGHRDYIIAHYKTNSRVDTEYWRVNAKNLDKVSDSLKSIFSTWLQGGSIEAELRKQNIEKYYPTYSWYALLGGVGLFPEGEKRSDAMAAQGSDLSAIDDFFRRCSLNFNSHRKVLAERGSVCVPM